VRTVAAIRNPVAALPEVAEAMAALPVEARRALRVALNAMAKDWRARGAKSWATHKPPMAAYWKVQAVNARHLALSIPKETPMTRIKLTERALKKPRSVSLNDQQFAVFCKIGGSKWLQSFLDGLPPAGRAARVVAAAEVKR
jgi:hypothetical protein